MQDDPAGRRQSYYCRSAEGPVWPWARANNTAEGPVRIAAGGLASDGSYLYRPR